MKYKPGRVDLQELTLFNHKGEVIDIRSICPEINIFNDIYGYGTQVEFILVDGTSLINSFPIKCVYNCIVKGFFNHKSV